MAICVWCLLGAAGLPTQLCLTLALPNCSLAFSGESQLYYVHAACFWIGCRKQIRVVLCNLFLLCVVACFACLRIHGCIEDVVVLLPGSLNFRVLQNICCQSQADDVLPKPNGCSLKFRVLPNGCCQSEHSTHIVCCHRSYQILFVICN